MNEDTLSEKKLLRALRKHEESFREGNIQAYLNNTCFDSCEHCYLNALPIASKQAQHIDTADFLHFAQLFAYNNKNNWMTLTGGDPLAHPDAAIILTELTPHVKVEVLTSGLALTKRNEANRDALVDVIKKTRPLIRNATSQDAYHSITAEEEREVKDYLRAKGFQPKQFGYKNLRNRKKEKPYPVHPLGRAKKLPESLHRIGKSNCEIMKNPNTMYVGYKGQLQYCIYTCNDGFMNISEFRDIADKEQAIEIMLHRLETDTTFKSMLTHDRCYFSKKIEKKK